MSFKEMGRRLSRVIRTGTSRSHVPLLHPLNPEIRKPRPCVPIPGPDEASDAGGPVAEGVNPGLSSQGGTAA
jgi:hypothetical protein